MATPNFFVAGVAKAGTTSLHHYLNQHPQIFMSPIKEPWFFGAADLLAAPYAEHVRADLQRERAALQAYLEGPQLPLVRRFVLEWADYLRLFRNVQEETAIGEASTGYSWLPGAAGAIRSRLPAARVILMLRDPAERLSSLYARTLRHGRAAGFRSWFHAMVAHPRMAAPVVGAGRYATHLQRFFDAFPRDQIHVCFYEDYQADPRMTLRRVFAFLGVDRDEPIDITRRHNRTTVPRAPRLQNLVRRVPGAAALWRRVPQRARRALQPLFHGPRRPFTMDRADREMVIAYYRDEIMRTGDLLDRDLSAWTR